jgi:hypothetical protein
MQSYIVTPAVIARLWAAPVLREACDQPYRCGAFAAIRLVHLKMVPPKDFKKSCGNAAMKSRFLPNRAGDRRFLD